MPFKIFGRSKIRERIMLLFVYNKGKEFYLSEVARHVKTSPGTAQRELNGLRAAGFLTFRKMGNLSVYELNPVFPLLAEVEKIVRTTSGIEVELRRALARLKGLRWAFTFGSHAKGAMRSDSDIDLFVIGDVSEDDVYRAVRNVEDIVGREIIYHISTVSEFAEKSTLGSFHREILARPLMLIGDEDELRRLVG